MASASPKVCMMGLGYIGLPTACILASKGLWVHGVDVNPVIRETISRGETHIDEPAIDLLVRSVVQSGHLTANAAPATADVFVIAVPTPFKENHVPDLSCVEAAARTIAPVLMPGNLVILESTSPVGTTEKLGGWLQAWRPDLAVTSGPRQSLPAARFDKRIHLAYCPERVLPGQILKELVKNDRIIGGIDRLSAEKARALYQTFVSGRILLTDAHTAEMCKLAENAFRDVNIAFANELSLICEKLGLNVWELIELANHHPRVNILQPGPGVGGHCIAVDPWFIVDSAPEQARLIRTAREVNDSKPEHVVAQIEAKTAHLRNPVIACLGLAFKADVDDLRESPAMHVVEQLAAEKVGRILAVEPHVRDLPPHLAALDVQLTDVSTALRQADLVLLLVNHREFADVDPLLLRGKIVVDTRGLWRKTLPGSSAFGEKAA